MFRPITTKNTNRSSNLKCLHIVPEHFSVLLLFIFMVRLAGLAIAWSQVRICLPTPTQRAVPGSVNENSYQLKLESKRAYHAMHWPCIRGLAASACVWLRARRNGDHLGMDLYTLCYLAPNVYWKFGITRFTSMRCTFQTTEAQSTIFLIKVGLFLLFLRYNG